MSPETRAAILDRAEIRRQFLTEGRVVFRGLGAAGVPALQALIARLLKHRLGAVVAAGSDAEPAATGEALHAAVDRDLTALHQQSPSHKSFVYDSLPHTAQVAQVAALPDVLDAVAACLGRPTGSPLTLINLNLRIDMAGKEWEHALPWHQDYPYRNKLYARGASAVVWMPIFDCPEALGPVEIKPGSHREGEITTEEISRTIGVAPHWTIPADVLARLPYADERVSFRAGDAVIFDTLLVHRSGINDQPNRIRWTFQARYSDVLADTFLTQYREVKGEKGRLLPSK